jgi:peptidoglycan hydrolase-like protein with peptidoglycan-binding domain
MKKILFVTLAAGLLLCGCGKKEQALEEMQQPMSPDDLNRLKTQATQVAANTTEQATTAAPEAAIVTNSGEKLEPLPPSGPFKPSAKEIQSALKNAGFYAGEVDGKLGPKSKEAVEEFQKANGLNADGKVGPKTWALLGKHLAPVAAPAPEAVQKTKQ